MRASNRFDKSHVAYILLVNKILEYSVYPDNKAEALELIMEECRAAKKKKFTDFSAQIP